MRASEPVDGHRPGFWLATLLIPVAFFAACEGLVRLTGIARLSDDPKLSLVGRTRFFEPVEIDGRPHLRVAHDEAYARRNIVFAAEKEKNVARVFCLGGSASAGWPHPPEEIFSAYLEQGLQNAYRDRTIEVINVSAHAYAAYRVRLIFDRVLEFQPDLIVLYTGNNEFLEKRTYLPEGDRLDWIQGAADRLAAVRLLRNGWIRLRFPENTLPVSHRAHVVYEQWSKIERIALTLRDDPAQLEQLKSHYTHVVESMVRSAADRGVPVVLVTVPVNLRDWHPNVSVHGLEGTSLSHWQSAFDAGRRDLLRGDAGAARKNLDAALAVAPEHAESHFLLGRALETIGDDAGALGSYRRAVDLDRNPFRALSEFNISLRTIAARNPDVILADAESAFLRTSEPHAPGFDLFLDYVHPTRTGNLILAETVFDAIVELRLLGDATPGVDFRASPSPSYEESQDVPLQRALVTLFAMMHQYESLVAKARPYTRAPRDRAPLFHRAFRVFSNVLELDRRRLLGEPLDPVTVRRTQAELERFYRDRFPSPDSASASGRDPSPFLSDAE